MSTRNLDNEIKVALTFHGANVVTTTNVVKVKLTRGLVVEVGGLVLDVHNGVCLVSFFRML